MTDDNTRQQQQQDEANAAYYDEFAQQSMSISAEVERILQEKRNELAGVLEPDDARAIERYRADELPLVVGLDMSQNATLEEKERMVDIVFSYIGVIPRAIDNYVGRWLEVIGCVVAPIAAEVDVDDGQGGYTTQMISWEAPLFKLASLDDVTGEHIILHGGGAYGRKFARTMTELYGPGDWARPRLLFISQEQRQGIKKATGEVIPKRMYRFISKPIAVLDKEDAATKKADKSK